MGEFVGEIGSRRDFQKDLGQIHTRQSRVHNLSELY
jgi:hypothetical protein